MIADRSDRARHAGVSYRPDIDGLRALAVLTVVLYHAGIPGFTGGFIGVDVFFVISGYLITGVIQADIRANNYSIFKFYERRIRRILPALFTVIAFAFMLASLLVFPNEFQDFCESVIATIAFSSNLLFSNEVGYFAAKANLKPLLHTWSLGVEEQFYIFYPLLLTFLLKYTRNYTAAIIAVATLLSLLASGYVVTRRPELAFYLPMFRAWELGFGCLIALGAIPTLPKRWMLEVAALAGVALILAGVFLYTDTTPFPGFAALLPCGGAALLIMSGSDHRPLVTRVLSTSPFVFIGLISYSLYLWHWPLLIFAGTWSFTPTPLWVSCILILASITLATISWRYIERPFRRRDISRARLLVICGVAGGALIAASLVVVHSSGWPQRFNPAILRLANYSDYNDSIFKNSDCFIRSGAPVSSFDAGTCLHQIPGRKSILLWGDSHAAHYYFGLAPLLAAHGANLLQATESACRPLMSDRIPQSRVCRAFNQQVMRFIRQGGVGAVVIAGHWLNFDTDEGPAQQAAIDQTVRMIGETGTPVFLVGPTIEYQYPLPDTIARYLQRTGRKDYVSEPDAYPKGLWHLDTEMKSRFGNRPGVTYVSILASLCRNQQCPVLSSDEPIEWDTAHLTAAGSKTAAAHAFGPLLPALLK